MSKLKRYVNFRTPKTFYCNSHIMPRINFSSTVWGGCSELNSFHRRAAKLLIPETSCQHEKQKALSILLLHTELDFNKALFRFKAKRSRAPCYNTPPRWPSGKATASRAEDPGLESRLRRDFFGVESYQ